MMNFHILLDNIERSKVFIRLYKASLSLGEGQFEFYTLKPAIYFYCKYIKKIKNITLVTSIKSPEKEDFTYTEGVEYDKDIHVLIGRSNKDLSKHIYASVYNFLESNINAGKDDIAIVFNGCHTAARSFSDYFKAKGARLLVCEISNLPGKMIFDPRGVNAQSILFENVEVLNGFSISLTQEQHEAWLKDYEAYKQLPIPQSKLKYKHSFFTLIDSILYPLGFGLKEESGNLLHKVKLFIKKIEGSRGNLQVGKEVDLGVDYYFFPTQVSTDTQILINSDVDNFEAISNVIEEAKKVNSKVYVKVHPAELDNKIINKYQEMEKRGDIIICKNNTVSLIKNSKKVFTINSTVGLESLIYGKDVCVFGRAIYSKINNDFLLRSFLHGYLVDLDYYNDSAINRDVFDKLVYISNIKVN